MEHHDQAQHHQGAPESPAGVGGAGRARSLAGARRDRASLSHRQEPLPPQEAALSRPQEEHRTAPHAVRPGQSGDRQEGAPSPVIGLITPAVCLDPAKAQKNLIRTPNSLQNHEQRRASAGKLCLGRYPTSHTRLLQRIPKLLLVEYNTLRAEILRRSSWKIQMWIIAVAQAVVILGVSVLY